VIVKVQYAQQGSYLTKFHAHARKHTHTVIPHAFVSRETHTEAQFFMEVTSFSRRTPANPISALVLYHSVSGVPHICRIPY